MKKDASDTFPEAEQTRWQETVAEDVFLPSVRVQLTWSDVETAVEHGAIVPLQAHALWANWAMPGSETRLSDDAPLGQRSSAAFVVPAAPENPWVGRPMPEIQRSSRVPAAVGFLVGASVALGGVAVYLNMVAS